MITHEQLPFILFIEMYNASDGWLADSPTGKTTNNV